MATIVAFPCFLEYKSDGTIDWDNDDIYAALVDSTASSALATATVWADLSSYEIANGNGYTTGGALIGTSQVSLANRVTRSGSTVTLDLDDVQWTASGGDIPAWRFLILYASKTANGRTNPLIGYVYESLSADVALTSENTPLIVQWNPAGLYTEVSA